MTLPGVLIFVALCAGVGGLVLLTQATFGVGLVAFACLLGIIARIIQAGDQHRDRLR